MTDTKPKRLTAAAWYGRAEDFWATCVAIRDNPKTFNSFVVCGAFAAEAFLKCLLTIRQKPFPPDHDLHMLFGRLPSEDKRTIETAWNAKDLVFLRQTVANAPADFDPTLVPNSLNQALKMSANAFKDWRYQPVGRRSFMVANFSLHVRNVILDAQPDWKDDPPDFRGWQSKDRAQKTPAAPPRAGVPPFAPRAQRVPFPQAKRSPPE